MSPEEQASSSEVPQTAADLQAQVGISYWNIVRAQFRKNHVAMFGRYCVIFLMLLAVYAPLVASDRPYWYSGPDPRPKRKPGPTINRLNGRRQWQSKR